MLRTGFSPRGWLSPGGPRGSGHSTKPVRHMVWFLGYPGQG